MTATSVQVKLVLGHRAVFRDKPTEQGYTHDWAIYVCGPDNNKIQPFVERVVFHLHESFRSPKRVIKDPPYEIRESGYAGFLMHIDVYFKNKDEPRKLQFKYDLFLNSHNAPPVDHTRCETLTFQNPAEEFRRRLIKGGGVGVPCANDYNLHHTKTTPPATTKASPVTKPPVPPEPDKEFTSIFGAPIKTEQHKKKPHSSSKEKHKSKQDQNDGGAESSNKDKTPSSKEKSSKRPLDSGSGEHSEKKKKKREDRHKEGSNDKPEKKEKSPKEKDSSSKHQKSPKDKDALSNSGRKSSHRSSKKSENSDRMEKSHKSESKSSKHKLSDDVHVELQKMEAENKMKKELQPFTELLTCGDGEISDDGENSNIQPSSISCSSIFEQMKGPYGTDEDSILSPLPERPDIFGKDSESEISPVKESSSKHKKKKSKKPKREKNSPSGSARKDKKSKDYKDRKIKEAKPDELDEPIKLEPKIESVVEEFKFVPKLECLSPDPDESPLHEDPPNDPDDPEQADSQTDAYEEEFKEEPPSLEPRAPSGELISDLTQIHSFLENSRDSDILQKVVDIIEGTGHFAVTDKTFNFDLYRLNSSTLIEIKNCIRASN